MPNLERRSSLENRGIPDERRVIKAFDELRRKATKLETDSNEIKSIKKRQYEEIKILIETNNKLIEYDRKEYISGKERIKKTYQGEVQSIHSNGFFAHYSQRRAELLKTLEDDFSKEVRSMDDAFSRKMQSRQSAFAKEERKLQEKHSSEMHRTARRQQGWTESTT